MEREIDYPFLHRAVSKGSLSMVKESLACGYNVNSLNTNGRSPLHIACSDSNISSEIIELLLAQNPNLGLRNKCGETALHLAVESRQKRLVECLLAQGARVDLKDVFGNTPLHTAAINSLPDIASKLLKVTVDINRRNSWGQTPLHLSVLAGDAEGTIQLLAAGADPTIHDRNGQTTLHVASPEIIQIMMNNNISLELTDINGRTPLFSAAIEGELEKVSYLIANNAYINALDINLSTALHEATHPKVTKCLLEAGIAIDHQDREGNSPLHKAAQRGLLAIVNQLIDAGANSFLGTNKGALALHLAAGENHVEIVKMLDKYNDKVQVAPSSLLNNLSRREGLLDNLKCK